MTYKKPDKRLHRGFIYLNDETVINSLSALEAGKIDEIVSKVNSAREGGFGGSVGAYGAKVEASKKGSTAFEDSIVRTRTRFSVFEIWYQLLVDAKALGHFEGWGPAGLDGVKAGDTIEFQARVEIAPIQTLIRSFLWFAEGAAMTGHIFSQQGQELKDTKAAAKVFTMLLGGSDATETVLYAYPHGEPGPNVAMPLGADWIIGDLARVGGDCTIIAQVDRVLGAGESTPTLRLITGIPPTPLEMVQMQIALSGFAEPAEALGVQLSANEASVDGPALWLSPIAIFR